MRLASPPIPSRTRREPEAAPRGVNRHCESCYALTVDGAQVYIRSSRTAFTQPAASVGAISLGIADALRVEPGANLRPITRGKTAQAVRFRCDTEHLFEAHGLHQ